MLRITRLACAVSTLAVLVSCGGGSQSTITPSPPPAHPPTPTTLRVLYRVLYTGTDRVTSIDFGERNVFPLEGQIYYVPDQSGSGRTALNRYFNAGITDHADGTNSPAGYTLEETLGYPWAQASLPVPPPRTEDGHIVLYDLKVEDHKDTLHLTRKLIVDVLLLQQKYYMALRNFFQAVRAGDEEQIVLQPGTTTAIN